MTLEQRVEALENTISGLINLISTNKKYTNADINGIRKNENNLSLKNNELENSIAESEDAICEFSEITEDNIAALEQAICDLSEEIGGR